MHTVLARSGEDLVEPVLVAPRTRPNRHPSGLHPWDYANLLALDARVSRDGDLRGTPVSVRLEAQDAKGRAVAMGTAPVEQDGSFFVKVPVDRPIRFALLDSKARFCGRSTDGSGLAAASSAFAWAAMRGRSAHRRIACRLC